MGTWDRGRLDQAIANLVSNAIKFGEGKPIVARTTRDGDVARFEITDHGPGIAPEHLAAVFQPFERADKDRGHGGLGLGLFIARTIVEALGGKLEVRSEPGRGSTFAVELPVRGLPSSSARGLPEAAARPPT
jgi:signal transduction histidine kinase